MNDEPNPGSPVEGTDFYREGPFLVFTAKYLRERGACCESGCRHCPWGYGKNAESGLRIVD